MKVDLMSLVNERSKSVTSGQKKIKKLFSDVCDISCEFAEYANEKKFITALAECIPEDDIIVLAAESMLFPAFKKFVAKALNLEMKNSKAVAKAILASNPDISEDEILKQSLIPAGTKPLLTNDGMYSGFAIKSKQRHI